MNPKSKILNHLKLLPFSKFTVSGYSMLPTLEPGQTVFTFNWFLKFKKGDLVVAKVKGRLLVKRVGKIRKEKLFLVGDNKKMSTDSRNFGWVSKKNILGKVEFVN